MICSASNPPPMSPASMLVCAKAMHSAVPRLNARGLFHYAAAMIRRAQQLEEAAYAALEKKDRP